MVYDFIKLFSSFVRVPYLIASLLETPGIHLVIPIFASNDDNLIIGICSVFIRTEFVYF